MNFCDCSLCSKTGAAWSYFTSDEVAVSGATQAYMRSDIPDPVVSVHSCNKCHATTHWTLPEGFAQDRVGVNVRIFDPSECYSIEARFLDGRNWHGDAKPQNRRPAAVVGKENFN